MLSGATALIVEDEYFIALGAQQVLESAGAGIVVIVRDSTEASRHSAPSIDLALVAIGPEGSAAIAYCQTLLVQGVAVVVLSSDRAHLDGVPGLAGVEVVIKPFSDDDLLAAVAAALEAAADRRSS